MSVAHVYRYVEPSGLRNNELRLATSSGADEHPYFFSGRMLKPRLTGQLLRALSTVVGARFYTPPNMLQRIIAEADPVVTSGGGMLRFEVFSECCSTYARVDLTPNAYEASHSGTGTTNVDFNAPMRAALSKIRDADTVNLSVGRDAVTLERNDEQVIERKVTLPLRWLRGFVEVQGYQAALRPKVTLQRAHALRFVRSLPRQKMKHASWIVAAGSGARMTQREHSEGVRVSGLERLRALEPLCPFADALNIYGDEGGTTSAWELDFGFARLTLLLTADVWRGFSGEGQALEKLVRSKSDVTAKVRAQLKWQSQIMSADVAEKTETTADSVDDALAALGARGLVGFDAHQGTYYHRELPFDLASVEKLQPRLINARGIVDSGEVKLERKGEQVTALVPGSGVIHRVQLAPGDERCTCTWFSKHQGERGPCKHILAGQIVLEAS